LSPPAGPSTEPPPAEPAPAGSSPATEPATADGAAGGEGRGGRGWKAPRRWWGLLVPSWVDANMWIILGARLSMSAARAIAGVVVALYLTAEGFSAVELGLIFLCVTVISAIMSSSIGVLSDRFGRKSFMVVIPLLAAVAAGVFTVSRNPAMLFVFASLGSFGRGAGAGGGSVGPYQPAESALVAEGVPTWARSTAFGRVAFVSSLGALFGGLLAGLARTHHHMGHVAATAAYQPAFIAAAVLAAVAGIAALGLHEHRATSHKVSTGRRRGVRWPRRSWPALWRLWTTNSVNGLAIGLMGPYVSYWLARRYGVSPGTIGLLFAIVNLGSLVSTLAAAGIGRRLGTVRAIAGVRAISGVLLVPMVLAPSFWMAGVLYFVRMMVQRVGLPLRQSFTQDLADPAERASLAALSNLPAQGTMAGSQVLAGYLFEEVSLSSPFELAAVFQCVNAALYVILFRGSASKAQSASPLDRPGPPQPDGSEVVIPDSAVDTG